MNKHYDNMKNYISGTLLTICASSCSGNRSGGDMKNKCNGCNVESANFNVDSGICKIESEKKTEIKCDNIGKKIYKVEKVLNPVSFVNLNKKVYSFDAIKNKFCDEYSINNFGSCDCCYFHDDDKISFVEFKLGNGKIKSNEIREKIYSTIEIIIKKEWINDRSDLKKYVCYYVVFSHNNNKLNGERYKEQGKTKLGIKAKNLVHEYALDYFKNYVLNDVNVLSDADFIEMVNCEYWNSKIMSNI